MAQLCNHDVIILIIRPIFGQNKGRLLKVYILWAKIAMAMFVVSMESYDNGILGNI